jgi:F-type H+-transporting ATPase subunit gamma
MSQLIYLKRRIRSIKTTQKLTHAMRLISMSLYSKLERNRVALEYHNKVLSGIFESLQRRCPDWKNNIFLPEDLLSSTPLFIIISATRGFCGGLNSVLFRYLEDHLFIEDHQSPSFITVGRKATDYITENKLGAIVASYNDLNSNNYIEVAQSIMKKITATESPYSSVTAYSSYFKNFFIQYPNKTSLIPIAGDPGEKYVEKNNNFEDSPLIWEQDRMDVIDSVACSKLESLLTFVLFQALISEYAARFVAMDNATTNAENYLEAMTLQFNKLRQALITREVSELSSNL